MFARHEWWAVVIREQNPEAYEAMDVYVSDIEYEAQGAWDDVLMPALTVEDVEEMLTEDFPLMVLRGWLEAHQQRAVETVPVKGDVL